MLRFQEYGATAKSATVMNYAGIGPDLVPRIFDSTAAKESAFREQGGKWILYVPDVHVV